jgi:hypothetical protein
MSLNSAEILERFDATMRRHPPEGATRVQQTDRTTLCLSADEDGWSAVMWSSLDEATADDEIAAVIGGLGGIDKLPPTFEWKYYAHDGPADLAARLVAAGLHPDEEEAVMIGEIAALVETSPPDPDIEVREVVGARQIEEMVRVHDEAFGEPHGFLGRLMERELELSEAERTQFGVIAYRAGEPVSAARIELNRGTEFASLWGGGTIPSRRGIGAYRAIVGWRAAFARQRGYRFLHVDALPTSRPILERIGFVEITRTTPFRVG